LVTFYSTGKNNWHFEKDKKQKFKILLQHEPLEKQTCSEKSNGKISSFFFFFFSISTQELKFLSTKIIPPNVIRAYFSPPQVLYDDENFIRKIRPLLLTILLNQSKAYSGLLH
jgi:hypothetical protein